MSQTNLLPGISSTMVKTPRLNTHLLSSGPAVGRPVMFIHGNVSSARFWEETMLALPEDYRALAPDLRGFGQSDTKPVDATRGVRDFSDDLHGLLETLGLDSVHLIGWSLGGGVVMQFAMDHPGRVASLTLVAPVSPYGYGSTKDLDGTPCWPDHAGSGGGTANPEFVRRLAEGDRSDESNVSPRNVMNFLYFKPPFRPAPEREEVFVSALLDTKTGHGNYPGDMTTSEHWPGVAPGTQGVLNTVSPEYFNLSSFAEIKPQPKVLWIRGDSDQIVSDASALDFGFLGQAGVVPGWPGEKVFPPQPMIGQMRAVLNAYRANGGSYREEVLTDCGHSPHVEQPAQFRALLTEFLGA